MIKSNSALLDRKTRSHILNDPDRRRVMISLAEAGLTGQEITIALNCSQQFVRSAFLARDGWFGRAKAVNPHEPTEQIDFKGLPRHHRGLLLYRPPKTEKGRARERGELASHLGREIQWWLSLLNLSDEERRNVISHARAALASSPFKNSFNPDRVLSYLLKFWRPA